MNKVVNYPSDLTFAQTDNPVDISTVGLSLGMDVLLGPKLGEIGAK